MTTNLIKTRNWGFAYICFVFAIADAYLGLVGLIKLGINWTTIIAFFSGAIVSMLGILELSK